MCVCCLKCCFNRRSLTVIIAMVSYTTYLLRFMPSVCIEGGLVAVRRGKGWWLVRGDATLVGLSADDPRARLGRGGGALVGVEERGKVGGSSWILERGVVIGGPRERRGGEKERRKVRGMMMYMYMQPLNSPPSPTSTDGLLGGTKWKYTECYKMKVFLYLYVLFPLHTTLFIHVPVPYHPQLLLSHSILPSIMS